MELHSQASEGALCLDARNWDEDAYRESILKEREIQTRAVFRTVWAPSQNPHPDAIVVASSDGAIASYSISSCISQLSGGFSISQAGNLLTAEPNFFLRAHDGFNANYLKVYYGNPFPYPDVFKWISYGHDGKHPACDQTYIGRREFSFTLDNDIYLRFQSFTSASELENSIKEKCPFKIDIGPVCSVNSAKRHAYAQSGDNVFTPVKRELIFDIDMSNYDDVRYCCSGADVCLECWPLMTVAIKVIDTALRDDFGFSHILWIYSGRRGVHCWFGDGKARRLSNEQKASIAEYFRVYRDSENSNKRISLPGPALHPFLAR